MQNTFEKNDYIKNLCGELRDHSHIDPSLYEKFHIKRGLRNSDGSGVSAGITKICSVHGYIIDEFEKTAIDGELIYRGYSINDLVENVEKEDRFGFEEVVFLLIFGRLPSVSELAEFTSYLSKRRELPPGFQAGSIIRSPSKNIMNKLSRCILALYSYEYEDPDHATLEEEMSIALGLIARIPVLISEAYQAKKYKYDGETMYFHPLREDENTAQTVLSLTRNDRVYTKKEAQLLDTLLMLQAEHGGGNNSTFTCRVLTSSGTDAFSTYSGAVNSLKGPRHGGANKKVVDMLDDIKANVSVWEDEEEVAEYLKKIIRKEAGDHSGLIYGMGHAVYTKSDPRAKIIKRRAFELAKGREIEREFNLLSTIEKLTPEIMMELKGVDKAICANVDMYSGLVYRMLGIPDELFTPLFATARIAGWAAHRMEEMLVGKRIIRPAYKAIEKRKEYVPIEER
jgi:citrate synthase